jgi:hypothetical protein
MNLLWFCLDFAFDAAGEAKTIELVGQKTGEGNTVFFKQLGGLAEENLKAFPTELENGLCDLLGAELAVSTANQEIVVKFAGDRDSN